MFEPQCPLLSSATASHSVLHDVPRKIYVMSGKRFVIVKQREQQPVWKMQDDLHNRPSLNEPYIFECCYSSCYHKMLHRHFCSPFLEHLQPTSRSSAQACALLLKLLLKTALRLTGWHDVLNPTVDGPIVQALWILPLMLWVCVFAQYCMY